MDPDDDDEETPTSQGSFSLPDPRLREAIGEEIRRLRLRARRRPRSPFPFTEDEEEDLLEETVYPRGLGALLQLYPSLVLEEDRRPAEQMPTADTQNSAHRINRSDPAALRFRGKGFHHVC
uniref:Uncharacterized protein n=1 Tax=Oryza punctata TaxID=4537 RepID=A0A0E0MC43_ORYPU